VRYINYLALSLSVSVSAIASEPFEIESPTSGRAVFKDLKHLEESAWKAAQAGEFERAGRYLRQAAGRGSRISALFLAQEYRNGGLIFGQNPTEADTMQGIYEQLKAGTENRSWNGYDDRAVQKQCLYINNAALARRTPWLAAGYSLIKMRSTPDYDEALEAPDHAMKWLLAGVLDDEDGDAIFHEQTLTQDEKERALEIMREGVICLNDQALFNRFFQLLGKGHPKVDFLPRVLSIAQASPFHSEQEKTELALIVRDNVSCLQSEWYPQLIDLCEGASSSTRNCSPFALVRYAMTTLLTDRKISEDAKLRLLSLFATVYKGVQSVTLKSDFAQVLDDDRSWNSPRKDVMLRLELLKLVVTDEAMRALRREHLSKLTKSIIVGLYGDIVINNNYQQSQKAEQAFFECFEIYYDLEPSGAVGYLKERYKQRGGCCRRTFNLDTLLALKGRDEEFYQTESRKTLSEDLDGLVKLLIESPERKQKAEGSLLSLEEAYNRICQMLSQPRRGEGDEEASRARFALETFISRDDLLEHYAERLAPQVGIFLTNHASLSYRYGDLLGRGPVVLRDAAFQALLTYLVHAKPESNPFQYTRAADDALMTDGRKAGYISDKPASFFNGVFGALLAVRANYPIQRMWLSMDVREPAVREEMMRQVRTYFNLPADAVSDEAEARSGEKRERPMLDLNAILGNSLNEAMQSNSLPYVAIHQFCEVAKTTGIYKSLPAEVLVALGDQIFWNEDAPLAQRCEAFNNILRRSAAQRGLVDLWGICQDRLPQSPLLSYVELAIKMIESTPKTPYAMYHLMGKMIELKKAHPEICIPSNFITDKGISESVLREGELSTYTWSPTDFTWLFNMKVNYGIGRNDENAPYVVIDHILKSRSLDEEGHLYGVVYQPNLQDDEGLNCYRLYKCNPYTGYAKWSMIISINPETRNSLDSGLPKYSVGSQYLYVMSGENKIAVFDRMTAEYLRSVSISDDNPDVKLCFIGAVGEDLFAAKVWSSADYRIESKAFLSFLPKGDAQGAWSKQLPPSGGGMYRFSTHGAYFVCTGFGASVRHYFNMSGKGIAIDGDPTAPADEHFKHEPEATVDGDMVFYTQKQGDNSFQLVHLNLVTGEELWRTSLPGEPKQAPVLSVARDCVFMFLGADLCAISTGTDVPVRMLWHVSTCSNSGYYSSNNIDRISASADGRYVYGLESNRKKFYRYDVKTGAEEDLGNCHGDANGFLGSRSDGKVFI